METINNTQKMILSIEFKPQSRIGNGMIAATSKISVELTEQKTSLFKEYGDLDLAKVWAKQILQQRFNEDCVLLNVTY